MSDPNISGTKAEAKLAPPPRPVPTGLVVYLVLLTTQLGWLFVNLGILLFWFNCAFGADVKSLLFLAPQHASGAVTSFEATPIVESTGATSSNGGLHQTYGTRPVFAIHYTYALPGGQLRWGTSYKGDNPGDKGDDPGDGPMIKATSTDTTHPVGGYEPVRIGSKVPVEYVRVLPSISRIQGTRSNVYPLFMMGVLVFTFVGAVLLRPAAKNYRRIQFLLRSGVEDAGHSNLNDPAGHLLNLPITGPAARWLGIREGQLHAPRLFMWLLVILIPVGGLLVNGLSFWHQWSNILYTWHSLTG